MRATFSTRVLFISVTLAAVFCAGWLTPSPIERPEWEPVLVANDNLEAYSRLSPYDVRVEQRLASTIPQDAARNVTDVDGWRLANAVKKHDFILLDDFSYGMTHSSPPTGFSVVNIRIDGKENQLLLSLLQRVDKVSVRRRHSNNGESTIIDCVRIFAARADLAHQGIVALLLDEKQKRSIVLARKAGDQLFLDLPTKKKDR